MLREAYLSELGKKGVLQDQCVLVMGGRGNDELAPSTECRGGQKRKCWTIKVPDARHGVTASLYKTAAVSTQDVEWSGAIMAVEL